MSSNRRSAPVGLSVWLAVLLVLTVSPARAQAPGGGAPATPGGAGGAAGGGGGGTATGGGATGNPAPTLPVPSPVATQVIIRDTDENLNQMEQIIRQFDKLPSQVLLDMAIMDVNYTSNDAVGLQLQTFFGASRGPFGLPLGAFSSDLTGQGTQTVRYGSLSTERYQLFLQFLKNNTHTKILSRPSMLVMDGQQATLNVGGTTKYVASTTTTVVPNAGTQVSVNIADLNTGPTVRIAPRILPNDLVLLHLSFQDQTLTQFLTVSAGTAGNIQLPQTTQRSFDAPFYVRNGNALLIGGLVSKRRDQASEKVPLLGYIPFIGRNFGRNSDAETTSELVMVIKATIVKESDLVE